MTNNDVVEILENVVFGITEEESENSKIIEEEVKDNVSSENK